MEGAAAEAVAAEAADATDVMPSNRRRSGTGFGARPAVSDENLSRRVPRASETVSVGARQSGPAAVST